MFALSVKHDGAQPVRHPGLNAIDVLGSFDNIWGFRDHLFQLFFAFRASEPELYK